jgi:tetratricopeptide (TPR) repeat protein
VSRPRKTLFLLSMLLAVLAHLCAGPKPAMAASYPPKSGKVHPQIVLYTLEGDRTMALSSLRDKKVLLIHFASWSEESRKTVPIWFEKAKPFVADGKLAVLGVAHEQYADRCRLFAQWKGVDWPILHDPLNMVRVESLPLVVGIDEHGIVRDVGDDPDKLGESFVGKEFAAPKKPPTAGSDQLPDPRITRRTASEARSAKGWRKHADALVLAGQPAQLKEAIETYLRVLKMADDDADASFRLGVTYRIRYDRPDHQNGDFQAAIDAWRKAVELQPENQVFTARLLQYGPSVDRPGQFYAWIAEAEKAVKQKGETPVKLSVEPTVMELAHPAGKSAGESEPASKDDPGDKAKKDGDNLVRVEQAVVRGIGDRGERVAVVYVAFRPDADRNVRWDASAPLLLWISKPKTGKLSREFVEYTAGPQSSAEGVRTLCFEIELPKQSKALPTIEAHAVYSVNPGQDGKPQLLQQDIQIKPEKKSSEDASQERQRPAQRSERRD